MVNDHIRHKIYFRLFEKNYKLLIMCLLLLPQRSLRKDAKNAKRKKVGLRLIRLSIEKYR